MVDAVLPKYDTVTRFGGDADPDEIFKVLRTQGAVIVDGVLSEAVADKVASELRPHFDKRGEEQKSQFNGFDTLRLSEILARSRTSADLIGHKLVMDIADRVLLPFCVSYRIGSCSGIEIWPSESEQFLHRDDDIYPIRMPGMEWQISALWALTDFTEENGATRVVLGSHDGAGEVVPMTQDDTLGAEMKKGSLLLYLGSTYHGGGANRSNAPRMALVNTYALGWLRQEENMYLSIPRDVAESYPENIRALMGYTPYGNVLGYIGDPSN